MTSIFRRLIHITRSYISSGAEKLGREKRERAFFNDSPHENPFAESSHADESASDQQFNEREYADFKSSGNHMAHAGIPEQVIEDLSVFGLSFPSSLSQVRKARNREIKKYHSDQFMDDPERLKTSKEIMQIFNAAYERLVEYYRRNSRS